MIYPYIIILLHILYILYAYMIYEYIYIILILKLLYVTIKFTLIVGTGCTRLRERCRHEIHHGLSQLGLQGLSHSWRSNLLPLGRLEGLAWCMQELHGASKELHAALPAHVERQREHAELQLQLEQGVQRGGAAARPAVELLEVAVEVAEDLQGALLRRMALHL